MATVYSLVCFGGLAGKTVTFTDAGDVVNLANHGLRQGVTGVVFSTTGSLPTGIVAGTTYYPRDGADAGKFTLYPTKANALAGTNQRTFTGTGSGTHTVKSAYMLGLTTEQKARYGSSGSERIYSDIYRWQAAITAILLATPDLTSHQVCEIGESFFDLYSANLTIYLNCGSLEITSKVNGIRSEAWHGGDPSKGFTWVHSSIGSTACQLNGLYQTIDGINIKVTANNGVCITSGTLCCYSTVKNNIFQGVTTCTGQKGSTVGRPGDFCNNIIVGIGGDGIRIVGYTGLGARYYNNLSTKCTGVGITSESSSQGLFYNNISVGNTTNWGPWCSYTTGCKNSYNFGEPIDKKAITVNYTVNANNITLTGHGRAENLPITFTTSGTLPTVVATGQPLVPGKVYYIRTVVDANTFTISATASGAVLAFSNNGSGTHYTTAIWSNDSTEKYIDMTTPNNVFVDYANNDFRYAGSAGTPNAAAVQVEGGMVILGVEAVDILGNVRPNYKPSTYPNEAWDAGPYEFDHLNGDAPKTVTVNNLATGSIIKVSRVDTGAVLGTATESSGAAMLAVGYAGAVTVEARCASSAPYYKPWVTQITVPDTLSVTALQDLDQ